VILRETTADLTKQALNLIQDCNVSRGKRASAYRQYGQWVETGRAAGGMSRCNVLYGHIDRLASYLYSPSELHFAMDWEYAYPKKFIEMGKVAARLVTAEWNSKNLDILFGGGLKEALTYGMCLMKHIVGRGDDRTYQSHGARLVMPWNFGVFNEALNDLADQECFVETCWLNRHEVWRRVRHLPDAEKLYRRILGNASADASGGHPTSFMHQVLSTAVLNTSLQNMTQPQPGGIVQLSNDPNFAVLGPQVAPELFPMYELWVRNDARANGYTTICLIEPDILISPTANMARTNLFIERNRPGQNGPMVTSGDHPYSPIYANRVEGYFWGRSEIVDLMMLQDWLTEHLDDTKRLMGQQIDKILGFIGQDGITDEMVTTFRQSGYVGLPPGSDIKDLTPRMPEQLIPLIGQILSLMDRASGFPPILGGQGEPGVRAGVHANTLVKTGSPRLRDRSLLVERLCASAAQTTLQVLEAKESKAYWLDPNDEQTDFLISQLPSDRRIVVDSHSSSPIYADDHAQLIAWGLRSQVIGPEDAIEDLPFARKEQKKMGLRERQKAQKELIEKHPEILTRGRGRPGANSLTLSE
jgi:hypothetical protein